MVVQAADNGWDLATNNQKQVLGLKAATPILLEKLGVLISGVASRRSNKISFDLAPL